MNFLPDRKVLMGGIAGVLAWLIQMGLAHYGVTMPIDPTLLPALIGGLISYVVPPADADIVKRINNDLVKLAQDDPTNPTTKPAAAPSAAVPKPA